MTKRHVHPLYAIKTIFAILLIISFFIPATAEQSGSLVVEYFYESGCSKCAQAEPVLNNVIQRYDNITYFQYEITTAYDGITGYDRMKVYGVYSVPAVVINQQTIITYSDYNGDERLLENLLVQAIENPPQMPDSTSNLSVKEDEKLPELSLLVVLIAGLLAGFNPCLLAVLAFLASITISSKGGRRDLLIMVSAFCAGIFAVYMAAGLGMLGVVKQQPGIRDGITLFLVVLIGLLGLWHLYDAYHLRLHNRSSFKTPESFIRLISSMEEGKNVVIISFLAGGIFSLVKAPCVGAVYFAILDLLITRGKIAEGSMYLGVYNLGVVLPVLILGVLLAFGLSPERITDFKENRRIEIRLMTGAVLVLLALLIYLKII